MHIWVPTTCFISTEQLKFPHFNIFLAPRTPPATINAPVVSPAPPIWLWHTSQRVFFLPDPCKALLLITTCLISRTLLFGFSTSHCHHLLTHCSQLCNPASHLHAHLFWSDVVGFPSIQQWNFCRWLLQSVQSSTKVAKVRKKRCPSLQEPDEVLWNRRPTTSTTTADLTHNHVQFLRKMSLSRVKQPVSPPRKTK